jgi:hypothetical protein
MNFFRKEEGMRNTKKIVKSFVSLMLALVLAFSFAPVSASAASATSKLRTNAVQGKKYKVKTVLPGNIAIKANVTVQSAVTVPNYQGKGATLAQVKMHVEYPKSEVNKVKNNVNKIVQSSPVIRKVGNYRYVKSHYQILPMALNRENGKLPNAQTDNRACSIQMTNADTKTFKQNRSQMEFTKSYDVTFTAAHMDGDDGNMLLGVAGVKSPTYDGDKKIAKFIKGSTSITKTNFYNKKDKSLSIWVKL